jgi:nitrous oxidase accessory protein NosD
MRARFAVSTLFVLAISLPSVPALAATKVLPGTGTLQAAIDAAAPGAVLLLTGGDYVGPVVINKPLKIGCATGCNIDANCEAAVAIDVASDFVMLRGAGKKGNMQVFRGTDTQIRIANHSNVDVRGGVAAYKLAFNSCGTEQVGIEVSGTSSKVKLGFTLTDANPRAGILLSGLATRSKVQIRRGDSSFNATGIRVENCADGAQRAKSGISIDKMELVDNEVGIAVVGSDGLRVRNGLFVNNANDVVGAIGVTLDASSDGNVFFKSTWDDRAGDGTSETDAGTGNCGSSNEGFGFGPC